MRGLFAKIFLGFWIAQSLTFLISTVLILRRQFLRPNEIMDVVNTTMPSTGITAANAYEAGGCAGLQQFAASSLHQTIYLAEETGHVLCGESVPRPVIDVLVNGNLHHPVHSTLLGDQNFWSAAIQSSGGRHYFFFLSR